MAVQGIAKVNVVTDPEEIRRSGSPMDKPFLRIEFANKMIVEVSTNLAEMIGGVGAGLRKRYEDPLAGDPK